MIYGYTPRQNDSFHDVMGLMRLDSELLGLSMFSKKIIDGTLVYLTRRMESEKTKGEASLAIIGLAEEFIQSQAEISDSFIVAFDKACANDPCKNVKERAENVECLRRQLTSYVDDLF